ncbi:MAG: hypothetical protein JO336_10395 [Acidobacteriia bacterium]|nr:hypothetical protein [Terriglobia bacterium]MBV8904892.1 hypothetical protein [Terriglobia bacterium]
MSSTTATLNGLWELPPLILYPFNERIPPSTLLDSSKAALMLSGLVPNDGTDPDDLKRRLLAGRYAEVRMLFFLGKDVLRWVEQCQDVVQRTPELAEIGDLRAQSFAGLLTDNPPENVRSKLVKWGVADYASVFSRGIGLNSVFTEPPRFDLLTAPFLCSYHHYADALFRSYMALQAHRKIAQSNFRFELYASGESSRMLEEQWGKS